jgi:hypothetical protein
MPDDDLTRSDLTRELHYMQTQVEQHGFPGTRAVLAELERLHAENARLRRLLDQRGTDAADAEDKVERLRGTLSQLLLFARGNEHVLRLIHDTLDAR